MGRPPTHGGKSKSSSVGKRGAHRSWCAMRERCLLPSNGAYHEYGAIGIGICERWKSFENFYEDMGDRPEGCTLDRKDGTKNYSPENCRWATPLEQSRNRKNTVLVNYHGDIISLREAAGRSGVKYVTVKSRRLKGWPLTKCLEQDNVFYHKEEENI